MSWGGVSLRGCIGCGKGRVGKCCGVGRLAGLEGLLTYTIRSPTSGMCGGRVSRKGYLPILIRQLGSLGPLAGPRDALKVGRLWPTFWTVWWLIRQIFGAFSRVSGTRGTKVKRSG